MKNIAIAAAGALLALAGSAGTSAAQDRGYGPSSPPPRPAPAYCCDNPPPPCRDGGARDQYGVCLCDYEVNWYTPTRPWNVVLAGGPGVRIRGRPVVVESGRIDIQGPPIYVEAPPIRIRAPQIYLRAPEVHIRPSDVTVEPPEIHYSGCEGLIECEPVSSGYATGGGERG